MEAKIRIQSKIENLDESGLPLGDIERSDDSFSGSYEYSGGSARLCYIERGESGEVRSEILVSDGTVTVKRSGAIESVFVFAPDREYNTLYSVVPYKFDVRLKPRKISTELGSRGGHVDLLYNMSIGGADKAVRMKIWIVTD